MSAEDNLGRQFTPNHKFSAQEVKRGPGGQSFITCCWHQISATGQPGANRWELKSSKEHLGYFRSSVAAKAEAKRMHEEGTTGFSK